MELYKKHFSSQSVLVNAGGCSEISTVWQYVVDKKTEINGPIVPIGYPREEIDLVLLNEEGKAVGENEVGEICVRSRYLFLGYWRKPELSAKLFDPDPEGGDRRIYHTGDLGYRMVDGCLVHVGRKDFQVKIRGFRIETAEIEQALLSVTHVKEAVVMAQEDSRGDKQLVAYAVAQKGKNPSIHDLRVFLKGKLPEYMVPAAFVFLEALPLTPNGKLNRLALPAADLAQTTVTGQIDSPQTPIEKELWAIWAEILKIQNFGVNQNFFELGGHSLLATRIISWVNSSHSAPIGSRSITFFLMACMS